MEILFSKLHISIAAAILTYAIIWYSRRKRCLPYPPGPPSDPLFGHIRFLPTTVDDETLLWWHEKYGDVLYFSVLGRSIILLNSDRAAKDLLVGRARIYSDRPDVPFFDFIGWGRTTVLLPYGEEFYKSRKLLQDYIQRSVGDPTTVDIQLGHSHLAMKRLLNSPDEFHLHISQFSAAVIVEIAYGHRMTSDDDLYAELTKKFTKVAELQGQAGAHPIDILPSLQFLPSWFPGTGFLQLAREFRATVKSLKNLPVEQVEQSLVRRTKKCMRGYRVEVASKLKGIASPSFLSTNLERLRDNPGSDEELELVKNAAFTFYVTGTETVATAIETTLFALLLYPDAQRHAQREIDRVLGQKRLPDFGDRETIPYIDHIIQESLRWHPPAPLGIPHRVMVDDVYQGQRIPKGSVVIANIRCMTMDQNIYRRPEVFYPERYIPTPNGYGEPYPASVFGFGRRQCPGQRIAEDNAWIFVAIFVAAFEIIPIEDESGEPVVPEPKFVQSVTSRPFPYKCIIRPRSEKMRALVEQL